MNQFDIEFLITWPANEGFLGVLSKIEIGYHNEATSVQMISTNSEIPHIQPPG